MMNGWLGSLLKRNGKKGKRGAKQVARRTHKKLSYPTLQRESAVDNPVSNSVAMPLQWYGVKTIKKLQKTSNQAPAAVVITQAKDDPTSDITKVVQPPQDATSMVNDLLAKHPGMTAATFLNLLKSEGLEIAPKASGMPTKQAPPEGTKAECDSATANAQVLRAEQKKIESQKIHFRCTLREADAPKNNIIGAQRFQAILLQEGLGNFKDAFYYTKGALTSAIQVFEGAKIYADHPTSVEESTRPERSVKDIIGHYENVRVETDKDGRMNLVGEPVPVLGNSFNWAKELMTHAMEYAKKYPDKEFVGLSINADGEAEETNIDEVLMLEDTPESIKPKLLDAKSKGITNIRLVSAITSAVSCDLVTSAGAGGKVLQILEANTMDPKKKGKEAEEKDTKQADSGTNPDVKKTTDDPGHADEEQDVALIKKMLDQYLGESVSTEREEEIKMAQKASGYFMKKKGMKQEEAAEKAAEYVEFAKAMAAEEVETPPVDEEQDPNAAPKTPEEEEAAKKEAEEKMKQADEGEEADEAKKKKEADEKCECGGGKNKKESDSIIALKGENAKLKEDLNKIELEKHLDKVLRESGLPMRVTKSFKESLGEIKSKEQIDNAFTVFKKGYSSVAGEGDMYSGLIVSAEKMSESKRSATMDFSDCKR
jgi:hypothetical protein